MFISNSTSHLLLFLQGNSILNNKVPCHSLQFNFLYNGLMQADDAAEVRGELWTVHNIKSYKDRHLQFQSKWRQPQQNKWKTPFEFPEIPTIVLKLMAVGEGKTTDGVIKIDLRFTKAVLERYNELNKSNVITTCNN